MYQKYGENERLFQGHRTLKELELKIMPGSLLFGTTFHYRGRSDFYTWPRLLSWVWESSFPLATREQGDIWERPLKGYMSNKEIQTFTPLPVCFLSLLITPQCIQLPSQETQGFIPNSCFSFGPASSPLNLLTFTFEIKKKFIVHLQCCVNFCCTEKWLYIYLYTFPFLYYLSSWSIPKGLI